MSQWGGVGTVILAIHGTLSIRTNKIETHSVHSGTQCSLHGFRCLKIEMTATRKHDMLCFPRMRIELPLPAFLRRNHWILITNERHQLRARMQGWLFICLLAFTYIIQFEQFVISTNMRQSTGNKLQWDVSGYSTQRNNLQTTITCRGNRDTI